MRRSERDQKEAVKSTAVKVGELARQTGVSVRTLHYYEELGLLSPSHRSEKGYRLYSPADVARLQQIKSLQQLGFSLKEVRSCLQSPELPLLRVIELHLGRLQEQITGQQRLRRLLEAIAERLRAAKGVSTDHLIQAIKEVTMLEKYYTPEQLEQLKQRRAVMGEEPIREGEAEWKELFAQFEAQMKRGANPASEAVQALARKAQSLILKFTGGDPGITRSLSRMYQQEGGNKILTQHGYTIHPGVWDYMAKATAALKESQQE